MPTITAPDIKQSTRNATTEQYRSTTDHGCGPFTCQSSGDQYSDDKGNYAAYRTDRNDTVTTVNRTREPCFAEFIRMDFSNCDKQRTDKCDSRQRFSSTNTNVSYSGSKYHWLYYFNTRYSSHSRRNCVLTQSIVPDYRNNAY